MLDTVMCKLLCKRKEPILGLRDYNSSRGVNDYQYECCLDGFGTITQDGSDDGKATVTDWKFGDIVLLNTTDTETGCLAVTSFFIGEA
jgi:hypothetical protein